jgi:peroxiredoxin
MRTIPTETMPAFDAELAGGGAWHIAEEKPERLALLVFYRGLHSPECREYLIGLERLLPELERRGISALALSCDSLEQAEQAKRDWGLVKLRIGGAVDPEDARKAGLYLTEERVVNASGIEATRVACEPGVLAVDAEGSLYAAWVQSLPQARPQLAEILAALDEALALGLIPPPGSA